MACKGCARLTVHKEPDLRDAGQVGMEGCAHRENGERFGFKARGMIARKGAGQVDDGKLGAGLRVFIRCSGSGCATARDWQ